MINDKPLNSVKKCCYFGSILSNKPLLKDDIAQRLAKASWAFAGSPTYFRRCTESALGQRSEYASSLCSPHHAILILKLLRGAESMLMRVRHRWAEHVFRMEQAAHTPTQSHPEAILVSMLAMGSCDVETHHTWQTYYDSATMQFCIWIEPCEVPAGEVTSLQSQSLGPPSRQQ